MQVWLARQIFPKLDSWLYIYIYKSSPRGSCALRMMVYKIIPDQYRPKLLVPRPPGRVCTARYRYDSHRRRFPWFQPVDPGFCPLYRHMGLFELHIHGCYWIITTRPKLTLKDFIIISNHSLSDDTVSVQKAIVRPFCLLEIHEQWMIIYSFSGSIASLARVVHIRLPFGQEIPCIGYSFFSRT